MNVTMETKNVKNGKFTLTMDKHVKWAYCKNACNKKINKSSKFNSFNTCFFMNQQMEKNVNFQPFFCLFWDLHRFQVTFHQSHHLT